MNLNYNKNISVIFSTKNLMQKKDSNIDNKDLCHNKKIKSNIFENLNIYSKHKEFEGKKALATSYNSNFNFFKNSSRNNNNNILIHEFKEKAHIISNFHNDNNENNKSKKIRDKLLTNDISSNLLINDKNVKDASLKFANNTFYNKNKNNNFILSFNKLSNDQFPIIYDKINNTCNNNSDINNFLCPDSNNISKKHFSLSKKKINILHNNKFFQKNTEENQISSKRNLYIQYNSENNNNNCINDKDKVTEDNIIRKKAKTNSINHQTKKKITLKELESKNLKPHPKLMLKINGDKVMEKKEICKLKLISRNNSSKNKNKLIVNSEENKETNTEKLNKGKTPIVHKSNPQISNSNISNNLRRVIKLHEIKKESYMTNIKHYSCKSKGGININNSPKTNQDNFMSKINIFNLKNFSIFGVFDGHGVNGHLISKFLKQYFTDYFTNRELYTSSPTLFVNEHIVYGILNSQLFFKNLSIYADLELKQQQFDSKFSGSTSVIVIHIEDRIICHNVGDSRAIYVTRDKKAVQISIDHKPSIPSEKMRINNHGGVVCRALNEDNEEEGPFRVYKADKDFPGLAMSRSFGDFTAKSIGVINEGDVFELDVVALNICAVILASDGLWEYLSNELIGNIAAEYYSRNDCSGCAKKLIDEASKAWKLKKCNSDDITVIVIFF